jgi:hypothetical protein
MLLQQTTACYRKLGFFEKMIKDLRLVLFASCLLPVACWKPKYTGIISDYLMGCPLPVAKLSLSSIEIVI